GRHPGNGDRTHRHPLFPEGSRRHRATQGCRASRRRVCRVCSTPTEFAKPSDDAHPGRRLCRSLRTTHPSAIREGRGAHHRVAYHAADQLDRCLATLGTRFGTTVVDNSTSPAVKAVAVHRGAAYVDAGRNIGFGAGANLALRPLLLGQPRDVLLLNPDTSLGP